MQFSTLALSAFAATAMAQSIPGLGNVNPTQLASIIQVLQTALPSSLLAEALTNSAAASSEIASSFSAGQTPGWFASLPSDVKSFLVPFASGGASASSALASLTSAIVTATPTLPSGIVSNSSTTRRTTSGSSVILVTGTSSTTTTTRSSSASSSSTTSPSTGLAAIPTAAYGMGIAGALGLVGLLAL